MDRSLGIGRNRWTSLLVVLLLGVAVPGWAADKYVRKGAAGNGSGWSQAYGDLGQVSWSGMASGDTLWIAAGTYTGRLPTVSGGASGLAIRRATHAVHGDDAGWSDAYDGQVTVDASGRFLEIDGDRVTVDGGSHLPWLFRVVGIRADGGMVYVAGNEVTIRNIEFDGNSEDNGEDGFRVDTCDALTIEHCYIHDYRYLGGKHQDALQMPSGTHFTYRYNISRNNGMHVFLGDVAWYGAQRGWVDDIAIYHNVFYNDVGGDQSYSTIDCKNCNRDASHYMYLDNNTFDVGARPILEYKNGSNPAQLYFRNNIVYESTAGQAHDGHYSHNAYSGSGPAQEGLFRGEPGFIDRGGRNYALRPDSPVRDLGMMLGYPHDIAMTSLPSGAGYPIGAFEWSDGGQPAPHPPAAPTALRLVP